MNPNKFEEGHFRFFFLMIVLDASLLQTNNDVEYMITNGGIYMI